MIIELNGTECSDLLSKSESIHIIDVRSKVEYDSFRLPGAFNLDILSAHAVEEISSLRRDQDYLIYCGIGVRSRSTIKIMMEMEFENLYHLTDGIANYPGSIDYIEARRA